MSQPIFLGELIFNYGSTSEETIFGLQPAYVYAAGFILSNLLCFIIMYSLLLTQFHCGMKLRLAVCSMIYRKSLKLSKTALGNITAGHVVNLISNDVGRLDLAFMLLHYIWLAPLITVVVSYLVFLEIGWSAFVGIAIVLFFVPLQGYLAQKAAQFRLKIARKTDDRVRLMNEIIQGIQVIKMYTWERPFGKMVELARV